MHMMPQKNDRSGGGDQGDGQLDGAAEKILQDAYLKMPPLCGGKARAQKDGAQEGIARHLLGHSSALEST